MDCSPPGFSVHGILQARILEWVAMPFSRGSSPPRGPTRGSWIAGRFFTVWAARKAPESLCPERNLCLWSQPEAQDPDGGFGHSWCLRQPVSPQKRPRPPETACSLRERLGSRCQLALPTLETACARPRRPWGGSPSWRLPQSAVPSYGVHQDSALGRHLPPPGATLLLPGRSFTSRPQTGHSSPPRCLFQTPPQPSLSHRVARSPPALPESYPIPLTLPDRTCHALNLYQWGHPMPPGNRDEISLHLYWPKETIWLPLRAHLECCMLNCLHDITNPLSKGCLIISCVCSVASVVFNSLQRYGL